MVEERKTVDELDREELTGQQERNRRVPGFIRVSWTDAGGATQQFWLNVAHILSVTHTLDGKAVIQGPTRTLYVDDEVGWILHQLRQAGSARPPTDAAGILDQALAAYGLRRAAPEEMPADWDLRGTRAIGGEE